MNRELVPLPLKETTTVRHLSCLRQRKAASRNNHLKDKVAALPKNKVVARQISKPFSLCVVFVGETTSTVFCLGSRVHSCLGSLDSLGISCE